MSNAANIVEAHATPAPKSKVTWLFSPTVDLMTFLGSAVLSLVLLAVGHWTGILHSRSPEWTWLSTVLLIDVAHVYATCWRVYFDREEFRRRQSLYVLAPIIIFVVGWALHSESVTWFWRILAYMAVFHFVRQQYGWVALYRARAGENGSWNRWLDTLAIYAATLYPLVWWHVHLPRKFEWMVSEDFSAGFAQLPISIGSICAVAYWLILSAYFANSLYRGFAQQVWNPGKDIVVLTTAICWYVGIITFNSDYAFTVTNVIIHGVPYFVLVYWYRYHWSVSRDQSLNDSIEWNDEFDADPVHTPQTNQSLNKIQPAVRRFVIFMGTLWLLAYVEELLWHRGVWSSRDWLFGQGLGSIDLSSWLVPLLAVPQLTHYVLDGFIWKRRSNPDFDMTLKHH
jgi:hypothetical protein